MIDPARSRISVLIGRVSTEDTDRILETLASLANKQGETACEVIIADRLQDAVSTEIARVYPQVRILSCPTGTSLPEMRTLALDASSGDIVAVTEDHCVPCEGWLGEIETGLVDPEVVAVGGSVENGVTETGFDWATFLCEYSYFSPPVVEGAATVLPGMNVAYRRSALLRAPRERLLAGFWETTVHGLLLETGGRFISRNAMKMFHCKKFSFRLFSRQRYVYSRYYAGNRFKVNQVPHRLAASAASLLLPPLLLWRMSSAASRKKLGGEFSRALPSLAALVLIWAGGEIVGYLAGPGDALAEIE